ncbi:response regulator [Candidatus Bathyarchaeota archaeon]|nr:response regulator [Candidatus Bathyarchaeota archaeon]
MTRILVADDESDIRNITARFLKRNGHNVDTAEDGAVALALAQKNPYDLIILDILMPKKTGIEVLMALKTNTRTSNTPILVFSAQNPKTTNSSEGVALADDFIQKPYVPSEFLEKVNHLIKTTDG